jgi:hypothetical protein
VGKEEKVMGNIERRKKRILKRKQKAEKKKGASKLIVKLREGTFEEKWNSYFGHSGIKPHEGATCVSCMNYIKGNCKGGNVPEYCMKEKRRVVYSFIFGSRSK